MSAIMSQNERKVVKIIHNAAKKFDWICELITQGNACFQSLLDEN